MEQRNDQPLTMHTKYKKKKSGQHLGELEQVRKYY